MDVVTTISIVAIAACVLACSLWGTVCDVIKAIRASDAKASHDAMVLSFFGILTSIVAIICIVILLMLMDPDKIVIG